MASRFAIEAIFRAVDKITQPLNKMGRSGKQFARAIKQSFSTAVRKVQQFGQTVKRVAGRVLRIGLIGALAGAGFAIRGFVKEAAKIEDIEASFRPLLGSLDEAKILVGKLRQTAVTTPFQLEGLSEAAGTLLAFRAATKDTVIPVLRMLGDTAQGSQEKLTRIVQAYGKIQAIGTVSMKEIRQLVTSNIPILDILQKTLNVDIDTLRKMVSAGKITSKDITKAFEKMTSAGGDFHKGMEIASKTLSGRFSTFKDNVKEMAATFGDALLPLLKSFLEKGIVIVNKIKDWAKANQEIIKQKFENFIENLIEFIKNMISFVKNAKEVWDNFGLKLIDIIPILISVKLAIWAINLAMAANPVGIVVAAVAALTLSIVGLVRNWDKAMEMMEFMWVRFVRIISAPLRPIISFIQEIIEAVKTFFAIMKDPDVGLFEGLSRLNQIGKGFNVRERSEEKREDFKRREREALSGGVMLPSQLFSSSLSETISKTEILIKNDGTSDVITEDGVIPPGGGLILPSSG